MSPVPRPRTGLDLPWPSFQPRDIMRRFAFIALLSGLACLLLGGPNHAGAASRRSVGPWDLSQLASTPPATWGTRQGAIQEVYYEGLPGSNGPTRIFAYLARPEARFGSRLPAVLLVHGGGGKAFREWAEHWAQRGYLALAMDLAGNGPTGRLPDGGPDQSDETKFREFKRKSANAMWTYHAVGAVIRGHSLLRSLPEVDPDRIGITGISWGGYLTCIVAGVDDRLQVAVPVYGCGFLGDNSYWKDRSMAAMTPANRALWLKLFDPGQYVGRARCPMLFLNGTTDFAYPLDSYQKTYRRVPASQRHLAVVIDLPHGHIWTFPEVDAFIDAALRGEPSSPKLGPTLLKGREATADVRSALSIKSAEFCYTTDRGPWEKRQWHSLPAQVGNGEVTATLPAGAPSVCYFLVKDERGIRASSEHLEFPAPKS